MTYRILLAIGLCTYFSLQLLAQSSEPIVYFKTGAKVFVDNFEQAHPNIQQEAEDEMSGHYFRYLQFERIPTLSEQKRITDRGIQLLNYLPDYTYLVAIPLGLDLGFLSSYGVRSVVEIDVEDKLDQRLQTGDWPAWAVSPGGKIKVMVTTYPAKEWSEFVTKLRGAGYSFSAKAERQPFVFLELLPSSFFRLAALDFVRFVDLGPDPGEPEDTGGRTLQRANTINSQLPGGLRYNGTGLNVLVRDDGIVGPHIDFEGRQVELSGTRDAGSHGDGVAGVMAGAGNLEPESAGSASGSGVYVINYESTFTDNTIDLHLNEGVKITNSSYSNGCNAGYTSTTQRVDQQMMDHPTLMHVFSGGNSNGDNCGYGAGNQWGNITGGHKQGKNVIAVANLFANGELVGSSSRGPAHDGRIKPDISAHGQGERSTNSDNTYQTFGGTSAAAPTMAGSFAQLYEVYMDLNNDQEPNTSLLKGIVLNTAHDMGNVGPDFKFGWGRIDALRAYHTLADQTYLTGMISQGQMMTHDIVVPAGVAQMKVMIYWKDVPGAVNTAKALVNDLDITVSDPSDTDHLPYMLNTTPDAQRLDEPATRGIDRLNNMEQVVIDAPAAGTYQVNVDGHAVPMGAQEYHIVWTFFKDEVLLTYPYGGENFVPGETQRLHWDAFGESGTFRLEYSISGGPWQLIEKDIPADVRLYSWGVPDLFSGDIRMRVRRGSQTSATSVPFNIVPQVTNLAFAEECKTGAVLSWDPVDDADSYEIFRLGEKYMETVLVTTETSYTFNDVPVGTSEWFAVAVRTDDGAIGRRTDAISYFADPAMTSCRNTIEFSKEVSSTDAKAGDTLTYTLTLQSFYDTPISGIEIRDTIPDNVEVLAGSITCGMVTDGVFVLDQASLPKDGTITCSFDVVTDLDSSSQIAYMDDIEGSTSSWQVDNLEGASTWDVTMTQSNSPDHAWEAPNAAVTNTQRLVTPALNIPAGFELQFYHWYDTEAGWDGGLIQISIDGGDTWADLDPSLFVENGYPGSMQLRGNPAVAGKPAFSGNSEGFVLSRINMNIYANRTIRIGFLFGEDSNTSAQGWYVDDVIIGQPYGVENVAHVSFDQGVSLSASVVTAIAECETNCFDCTDGIQNYGETGVDCGGPCAPCPCTEEVVSITFMDTTITMSQVDKVKGAIISDGALGLTPSADVFWQADDQILINHTLEVAKGAQLQVTMEDCSIPEE